MNVLDIFNSLEIATFVWVLVFSVYVLMSKDVRKAVAELLKSVASRKMLLPVFLLSGYMSGIVYVLHEIGLWNVGLLKDALFWLFSAGLLTMYKYVSASKGNIPVKKLLYDNLKIIVVLEFTLNTFTLSLWAELVIVPIVTFVVMLNAYVEATDGNHRVAKLFGSIQALLGLVLVGYALYNAIVDYRVLGTLDTLRSFLLPILLSTAIIPAAYLFAVYTNFESLFVGFRIGKPKSKGSVRYCKWQVILHCGLSTRRIAQIRPFDLMHLESKEDVKSMLAGRDQIAMSEDTEQ